MPVSKLMKNPKSQILEKGYVDVYSKLTPQEKRGLFYSREYKKLNPDWDDTRILLCQYFVYALKALNPQSEKREIVVLDAGCGHGNYVIDEFRSKITWACGVDLNKEFTKKNICLDEIKHGDLSAIPYENNTFDIVLSLWVVEHLKDLPKILREIHRVLKPGGYFIFSTPNKSCLLILLKRLIKIERLVVVLNKILYGREEDVFPVFYRANDLKTLGGLLENSGFEDINLKLNYDPSYTSFNKITFKISNALDRFFEKSAPHFCKQHIVGMVRKPTEIQDDPGSSRGRN